MENIDLCTTTTDEEEQEGSTDCSKVYFNKRKFINIIQNLQTENYYVVSYSGKLNYVGKVINVKKHLVTVKFMTRKTDTKYHWPQQDKIEDVHPQQIICGPIKLTGSLPFKIIGVEQVLKDYNMYMRSLTD